VGDVSAKIQTPARFKFTPRIAPPNCTLIFTKHDKSSATVFKARCKRTSLNCHFMQNKPYPLSKQGFYGSPIARRKLRGVPRDGHAIAAKHPAGQPAKYLASYPRNVSAMAGQRQRQCRWMAGRMTRKTTCVRRMQTRQCPRRKLARRLALNLNHDIQKL
jgi:hypothetical protein